jgi:hypothetical protein
LYDHAIDIELLAMEASAVFEAARSALHVRWLALELQGYGAIDERSPLHEVLGVSAGDRLEVRVLAYRAQVGQIVTSGGFTGRPFRHFFVEPICDLSAAAQRVRGGVTGAFQLDFGPPGVPNYPAGGVFPPDIFDRILLGFRAVLHLQLGSIVE